jgi:uncharacterized membrane protein
MLTPHYETRLNYLSLALLVALIGLSIYGVAILPDQIPVHFGLSGQADRWGSSKTLFLMPVVCLFVQGILWFARHAPVEMMNFPGPRTPENTARQIENTGYLFATLRALIALLFLGLMADWISAANVGDGGLGLWPMLLFLGLIFVAIGFFMVRAYRLVRR